jgi:hypothetical protein
MAYNPQMEQLRALQALTQQITNQYGGGNDVKSGILQNEAYVQGARQLGLTDADIAQTIRSVPWNDSTRYIPAQPTSQQGLMADELGPAPADAISGTIPAPAAPAPMAAQPEAQQGQPSFFQRVGQRFDQAATGGIIDPTTLTKDQRRILRGQLLMNVGGALAQNRPVGEGFQQQYNMLNKRQEEQAAKAKAALTEQQEATRQQIFQASDWSTPEGAQKLVRDLASAGLYDDAMEVTKNVSQKFKDGYTVMSDPVYGTILVDPTGRLPSQQVKIPGATPQPEGMSMYDAARLDLQERELALKEAKTEEAKKDYNPLTSKDSGILEKNSAQLFQVETAIADFKPEYAGKTFGGEALMAATRVAPDRITSPELRNAAAWWSSYDRYKNVVRNELFGASLTANEQEAFNKADINPNMSPELIKKNLALQQKILRVANARKAATLVAGNVNPEQVSIAGSIDFTGRENPGYAPEKWDSWTAKQKQLAQREFWKNMIKPGVGQKKPATAPKTNDDALVNKYLQ